MAQKGGRTKRPSSKKSQQLKKIASATGRAEAKSAAIAMSAVLVAAAAAPKGDAASWLSKTMETMLAQFTLEDANQVAKLARTLLQIYMTLHGGNGGGMNHTQ